jgi:hypothetical protein
MASTSFSQTASGLIICCESSSINGDEIQINISPLFMRGRVSINMYQVSKEIDGCY